MSLAFIRAKAERKAMWITSGLGLACDVTG